MPATADSLSQVSVTSEVTPDHWMQSCLKAKPLAIASAKLGSGEKEDLVTLRTSRRGSVLWDKVPPLTTRSRILTSSKPTQPLGYGRAFEGPLTEVAPCSYN